MFRHLIRKSVYFLAHGYILGDGFGKKDARGREDIEAATRALSSGK